jgi:ADP-ribose pyrophosphatase YjhB (NUDIX family)
VVQQGRLLLGRRAIEPAKGRWDIPGGFVQIDESAEEAARREVREETGLEVALRSYLGSFPDTYGPRRLPILNLIFEAMPTGGELRAVSDVAELHWFSPADLPREWAFPHQPEAIDAWRRTSG